MSNTHNTLECYYNGRGSKAPPTVPASSPGKEKEGQDQAVAWVQTTGRLESPSYGYNSGGRGGGDRGRGRGMGGMGGRSQDRPKICLFCTEEGHWRHDCPEAQEYDRKKAEKLAQATCKQASVSIVQIESLESVVTPEVCVVTRARTKVKSPTKGMEASMINWPA